MLDKYKEFNTLDIQQEGRLLRVTLNRPETLNAFGAGMHEHFEEFFYVVRGDDSVGAILLSGAGRAFSSGGDVKGMAASSESRADDQSDAQRVGQLLVGAKRIIMNMLDVDQPIVCALHGYAMGLGATIALMCDVVVAADDAVIADTHVVIGLVAGDGGTIIWPLLLPVNTAKYYLLTGDRISGKEAERLGLVFKSVPLDEVKPTAEEIALRLANGPTLAIRYTKNAINKLIRERANLLFDNSLTLEGVTMLSDDHREATGAMVEKRKPNYTGR